MLYRGVFALVLLTLLALVTACGAGVAHAQSETVPGSSGGRDREALVALYNATGGPNWADSTNWLSEGPIGEWYGVTADATGRVTHLDLNHNNLSGPIPAELGNLSNLRELVLWQNQLSGPIPPALQNLTQLAHLDLDVNRLSGTIPPWLGDLEALTELHLRHNQFEGSIPPELGKLPSLTLLSLHDNLLTGQIPSELGNLSSLTDLRLYNNRLTGSIPAWLGDLSNLTVLYLGRNELTGPIPTELQNLSKLKGLGLWEIQLSGTVPSWIGEFTELERLYLSRNQLEGPIPVWLSNLSNLTHLNLAGNQLTGPIPTQLGNLSNLTALALYGNQLTGSIPPGLGNLSKLTHLQLYQNQFTGPIPTQLGNLSNLTVLALYGNQLTGSIPPGLGNLSKLTYLQLYRNQLTGPIPSQLGSLSALKELILYRNQFTGSIPAELGDLTSLDALFLDGNQLTGPIPASLGDLTKLRRLSLHHNLLSGAIPESLTNLADLERIELAWNAFTGCVPVALRDVPTNDLGGLGLPYCGVTPSASFSTGELEALFDEIVNKTEQREAFSEIKEKNIGFSALEDMNALRSEFVASRTETDLYYALMKLSNARRDRHLRVEPVDGGLQRPERASCISAPVHILPDLTHIKYPTFFVAWVGEGRTTPKVGDTVVGVNGRSMAEYVNEFTPWIRHSSLHALYWQMAYELPQMVSTVPPQLYSEQLNLTLENPWGQRYEVSLPYTHQCRSFDLMVRYPGFCEVLRRESFNVMLDRSRRIILLRWYGFRSSLVQDVADLMEYAEREKILDYDMIIDVTYSGGGSGGAYAIQRLVDQPFRPTFGNVRLSDLGKELVERYAGREPDVDAPDVFGLNLSRSWLIDWARTDAMEAIRRGDAYTPPVPFKLAHLPKDSDGILQPAPTHFSGEIAVINARTSGGSHLDQFMAMLVDNDLATFIGVPTGGYSNTWEGHEVLRFQDAGRPLVNFMWSIGHTIRPNGEVLEGNPAQPDIYIIPITRDNFRDYHRMLFDDAIAALDPMRASTAAASPTDGSCIVWKIGGQVDATVAAEARQVVIATHDTLTRYGMPDISQTVTIFLYHDSHALEAAVEEVAGRTVDAGEITTSSSTSSYGARFIIINTASERFQSWSSEARQRQIVGHMVRIYNSLMSDLSTGAPSDEVPPAGPQWLMSGAARYFTWQTLRPSGPESCDTARTSYAGTSVSSDAPLGDLETREGYNATNGASRLSFLAVELLAEQAGPEAVVSYYASLRTGVTWQEAFQTNFGMTVAEFYQLFEERRAAGFPRPRCPLLPPLVTLPDVPEYLKWEIGDGVSDEQLETIVRGIRVTHEFARAIGLPEPNDEYEIIVYVYNNIEKMVAAHGREVSWGVEERRRYWTGPATASAGTGKMFFGPRALQDSALIEMASHEFLHANYQQGVLGQRTTPSAFDRSDSMRVPRWLTEGMAVLLTQLVMSQYHDRPYPDFDSQENWMSRGAGTDLSLWDAELYPAQGHVDLISDETERKKKRVIVDCIYRCGVLAVELLASLVGIGKLSDYWMYLERSMVLRVPEADLPRTGWVQAFERAYGMTVEEFYELFEEHRAAGFPDPEGPTPTATPKPEPVVHPSDILDWFDGPPDEAHSYAAKSIERMWDLYPDLAAGVARLIWVGDGITWNEEFVLEELSYVVSEDPELVRAVVNQEHRSYLLEVGSGSAERAADYPWLADGMNARELYAIIEIARIAKRNPGFAERVLGYTWLADGITWAEARGLGTLSRWILVAPELVDRVLKYTWLGDGITDAEKDTLSALYSFAERVGIEAAAQVMDYQWLADGVTWEEVSLIAELASLVADDPEAARQISRRTLVPYLLGLASGSSERAADHPWLADGLDARELLTLIGIAGIAKEAQELAERLLGYTWLADGVSERESNGVIGLADIAHVNLELARQVVGMGILDDPLKDRDLHAITSLRRLVETDDLALLTSQPWFTDGLSDEETAFLVVTNRDQHSDSQYRDFLRTHFTRSATISLPLAGDVDVWVFWHLPFPDSDDSIELIEDAVRASEALMGVPFPTTDIILLLARIHRRDVASRSDER